MPATRSRRRRVTLWVGVALMVGGAVLLGWVGWQLWGTNWVAHRQQDRVGDALQARWNEGGARLQPKDVPNGEASALIADDLLGALPHRQPDDRVRAPGPDRRAGRVASAAWS